MKPRYLWVLRRLPVLTICLLLVAIGVAFFRFPGLRSQVCNVTGSERTVFPVGHGAFVEDFDGPLGSPPDPDRWDYVTGTGWDSGIQKYTTSNAFLDGEGRLSIHAVKTETGYNSGRVQTKNKINIGYGTLTARIKMPSGQGLWPAFWLVGADEDTNPWPAAGEIDIIEFVSTTETHYSAIHGPISWAAQCRQAQIVADGPDMSLDYHNYWMIHLEDSITVGVDDTIWGTFTPNSIPGRATWVFNKPFYVILSLAIGGKWAGPPDRSTRFPATMLIDWLRWEPAREP